MRENRKSGSEGGGPGNQASLPLLGRPEQALLNWTFDRPTGARYRSRLHHQL